jgi:hypothetical protein
MPSHQIVKFTLPPHEYLVADIALQKYLHDKGVPDEYYTVMFGGVAIFHFPLNPGNDLHADVVLRNYLRGKGVPDEYYTVRVEECGCK